jgi:hypothetical protein
MMFILNFRRVLSKYSISFELNNECPDTRGIVKFMYKKIPCLKQIYVLTNGLINVFGEYSKICAQINYSVNWNHNVSGGENNFFLKIWKHSYTMFCFSIPFEHSDIVHSFGTIPPPPPLLKILIVYPVSYRRKYLKVPVKTSAPTFFTWLIVRLSNLVRYNCQAQSQLQVKLSLKTELALFPLNPATPPPAPHPPGKVYFPTFVSECWPS